MTQTLHQTTHTERRRYGCRLPSCPEVAPQQWQLCRAHQAIHDERERTWRDRFLAGQTTLGAAGSVWADTAAGGHMWDCQACGTCSGPYRSSDEAAAELDTHTCVPEPARFEVEPGADWHPWEDLAVSASKVGDAARITGRSAAAVRARRSTLGVAPRTLAATSYWWTAEMDSAIVACSDDWEVASRIGVTAASVAGRRPVIATVTRAAETRWTSEEDRIVASCDISEAAALLPHRTRGAIRVRRGRLAATG